MQGAAEEREGKLYFKGTTNTQAEANKISLNHPSHRDTVRRLNS